MLSTSAPSTSLLKDPILCLCLRSRAELHCSAASHSWSWTKRNPLNSPNGCLSERAVCNLNSPNDRPSSYDRSSSWGVHLLSVLAKLGPARCAISFYDC